jgi:hypothetical protein
MLPRMSAAWPLPLFILGLVLFVGGDVLWLLRNTFDRPMNLRVTGGLVFGGVALMSVGLLIWAVADGGE